MALNTRLIRRGDIWLVNYAPDGREGEAGKTRPGLVVTNNIANAKTQLLMTVPITSNTERVFYHEVFLPVARTGLEHDSKAQVAAMRGTNVSRLIKRLGFVLDDLMLEVDTKMRTHLGL